MEMVDKQKRSETVKPYAPRVIPLRTFRQSCGVWWLIATGLLAILAFIELGGNLGLAGNPFAGPVWLMEIEMFCAMQIAHTSFFAAIVFFWDKEKKS